MNKLITYCSFILWIYIGCSHDSQKTGSVTPNDSLLFCFDNFEVLHNQKSKIDFSELQISPKLVASKKLDTTNCNISPEYYNATQLNVWDLGTKYSIKHYQHSNNLLGVKVDCLPLRDYIEIKGIKYKIQDIIGQNGYDSTKVYLESYICKVYEFEFKPIYFIICRTFA